MNQGAPDIKTADICDRFSSRVEVCAPIFTSYGGAAAFNGPISTVEVYGDNVLVREALENLAAGAVLVVDGGGSRRCALLGDKLASIAASRGLKGVIVNGCVRDAQELGGIEFGVLALATNPLTAVPVSFGGVTWTPGQYVYADDDGVVVAREMLHDAT
jgi:regulator of ribonuclease activity A